MSDPRSPSDPQTSYPDLADLSQACRAAIAALSDGIQPADAIPLLRASAIGILWCTNRMSESDPHVVGESPDPLDLPAKLALLEHAASGNVSAPKPLLRIFLELARLLLSRANPLIG